MALSLIELRRMVKSHNVLMSITIPPNIDRDGLMKLIKKNGYDIDHMKKKLIPRVKMKRKPTVNLPPPPPVKTVEEKKVLKEMKIKREIDRDKKGYDKELERRVGAVKKAREVVKKLPAKKRPTFDPKDVKVVGIKQPKQTKQTVTPDEPAKTPKIFTGGWNPMPNGDMTKDFEEFKKAWVGDGFKVVSISKIKKSTTESKPVDSKITKGKFINLFVVEPVINRGKKNQYVESENIQRGDMDLKTFIKMLRGKDFKMSQDLEKFLNDNTDKQVVIKFKQPIEGGTKIGKFKTLQKPFTKATVNVSIGKDSKVYDLDSLLK